MVGGICTKSFLELKRDHSCAPGKLTRPLLGEGA